MNWRMSDGAGIVATVRMVWRCSDEVEKVFDYAVPISLLVRRNI